MLDAETKREIREEIKNQANVILNCLLQESTTEDQAFKDIYKGAPNMGKRPVIHPYGFVSRAPSGKIGVAARLGNHPAAQIIIGVRDSNRKDITLNEGDICLYDSAGQKIVFTSDKIKIGSENASDPAVLGTELKALLTEIINLLLAGDFVLTTGAGSPTAPNPAKTVTITQLKTQYLDTANTNILSQQVFIERSK